ncbi:MAG: hypothetical protein HYW34_01060 [Candidatus Brennerbacteria bacterium]|nr:hypothetical protein [Candidatus Brennerbacteria bacterium]
MPLNQQLRIENLFWLAAPLGIFLFFLGIFVFSQLSSPQFSSFDDPAYHLTHSLSYLSGEQWQNPVFSTLSTRPVDLWYAYHLSLAYFIKFFGFDAANYLSLIVATKIFHSILSALFFTAFFLTIRSIIALESQGLKKQTVLLSALLATLVLFFIMPSFTYRLFIYRPHIIAMIFVLASAYFSYKRSWPGIAVISFLMPFFYSLALFVLIPPFIHGIASVLYNSAGNIRSFLKLKNVKNFGFFFFATATMIAGIIARPDSLNYLYNGFYIPLLVIYNNAFTSIDNISELAAPQNDAYALALPFLTACFVWYARIRHLGLKQTFKFGRFYIFLTSQVFFLIMAVIARGSEYAAPIIMLFLSVTLVNSLIPAAKQLYKGDFDKTFPMSPVLTELTMVAKQFITGIANPVTHPDGRYGANRKKILIYVLALFILFKVIGVIAGFTDNLADQPAPDMYKGAAEFMSDHSKKGDIVFQQRFDMYPRLVFFNQKNSYIMGMSESFTSAYDPGIFWLWSHIVTGEPVYSVTHPDGRYEVCPRKKCGLTENSDVYETIKNIFKARYVFIDSRENFGNVQILNTPGFTDLLESDSRFKKVFIDPKYHDIMVFEV